MAKNRVLRDIPDLVKVLREQKARKTDKIVPVAKMEFVGEKPETKDQKGNLFLRIDGRAYGVQDQVHSQFASKFGISGHYYSHMRERGAHDLLATNLNYWRGQANGDKRLVRFIDDQVRAFVSDRYRPVDDLDLLTTAIQVVLGKDGPNGEEKPWARGAKAFDWGLSPTRMDVCLLNPGIQIDLNDLKAGVQSNQTGDYRPDAPNHGWIKNDKGRDGGSHFVFPAARITNSETGHGGYNIQAGIFEAICDNTAWIGFELAQRHLGRVLEEDDFLSPETLKKENEVIFSKVADIVRSVFSPENFLENAKKMKGLQKVEIEVKVAVNQIATLPGMTEEIRDDILSAYEPLNQQKDTLLDLQRAVTAAAHARRETDKESAYVLEELGGQIIEKGEAVLK